MTKPLEGASTPSITITIVQLTITFPHPRGRTAPTIWPTSDKKTLQNRKIYNGPPPLIPGEPLFFPRKK